MSEVPEHGSGDLTQELLSPAEDPEEAPVAADPDAAPLLPGDTTYPDNTFGGSPKPGEGSAAVDRALRFAAWFGALTVAWFVNRGCSMFLHLPADGVKVWDPRHVADDFNDMFHLGFVLAWFAQVDIPGRFSRTSRRTGAMCGAAMLLVGPLFALVSDASCLQHSLQSPSRWGPGMWAVTSVSLAAVAALVVVCVRHAYGQLRRGAFAVFVLSRCVVLAFYSCCLFFDVHRAPRDQRFSVHVHHLYIGWFAALFAEFDTWWSNLTLAVGAGLFVQGCSAYDFGMLVEQDSCFNTIKLGNLLCNKSAAEEYFVARICINEGTAKCYTTDAYGTPPPPPGYGYAP